MDKQTIIHTLTEKYQAFVNYLNELTADAYAFSFQGKWTAAQQLHHIVLCVKPLVQVFSMDKVSIEQTFGHTDRQSRSYEVVLQEYLSKLTEGGKAPTRFVPEATLAEDKEKQCEILTNLIQTLSAKIQSFSEQELDSLLIPHPLLGSITLREMLYNAIYHVEHHQNMAKKNLKK